MRPVSRCHNSPKGPSFVPKDRRTRRPSGYTLCGLRCSICLVHQRGVCADACDRLVPHHHDHLLTQLYAHYEEERSRCAPPRFLKCFDDEEVLLQPSITANEGWNGNRTLLYRPIVTRPSRTSISVADWLGAAAYVVCPSEMLPVTRADRAVAWKYSLIRKLGRCAGSA